MPLHLEVFGRFSKHGTGEELLGSIGLLKVVVAFVQLDFLSTRNPSHPRAMAPLSRALRFYYEVDFHSRPVLHILVPFSPVLFLVRVGHHSLPVLLSILEGAHIDFSIFRGLRAKSVHHALLEFSYISFLLIGVVV